MTAIFVIPSINFTAFIITLKVISVNTFFQIYFWKCVINFLAVVLLNDFNYNFQSYKNQVRI